VLGTGPATQSVMVRNSGFGTLLVDPPVLEGADYTLANGCPLALPAGGSCAVNVTFAPTGVGQRGANLTIRTSAPNGDRSTATGSTRVVPIIGAGSNPPPPPAAAGTAARRRPALTRVRPTTSARRRTVLRRGLTLRVRIRNASRVLVRIRRGRRLVATRTVRVRKGRIRLADARLRRLLRPGTYTVALTPITRAGVRGTTRVVRVRIRR
jgi:hypothetical protein